MLSFHLSLVGEKMSGDREATSDYSFLVRLDAANDKVRLSSYDLMTEYQMSSQEKGPSAHFSEEKEREEEEEEEEEGEQQKVFGSNEERRLYVGNLPYSMTSAQLAEIFEQAGHVVSVEVCDSLNLLVSLALIIFSNVILGCLLAVLGFI